MDLCHWVSLGVTGVQSLISGQPQLYLGIFTFRALTFWNENLAAGKNENDHLMDMLSRLVH